MNRYAIGDIHGGLQTFLALIRQIKPRHNDRVYLLGDYIDRGPDSKGVLDAIISIQEAGCDIRPIRGNHDDMLLRSITGQHDNYSWYWEKGWGQNTFKSFGVNSLEDIPDNYLTFLESLPYCYQEDSYLLVHAGLDMTTDNPLTDTMPEQMLWGDSALMKSKVKGKTLVVGHHVRPMPLIEASLLSNQFLLDNGAFTDQQPDLGNLVALNLDTLQLTVQPWIDGKAVW
jgi:serine/threonine protein phosphatase 1